MNKEGKQRYLRLRKEVTSAVNRADPIGLLALGAPADEYDPEIGTVLPRLRNAGSAEDVTLILHEEFSHWFGSKQAGARETYAQLAAEIWQVLGAVGPVSQANTPDGASRRS